MRKFEVLLDGKMIGYLLFDANAAEITAISTFVPIEYRGLGVAKTLVEMFAAYAKINNLQMKATCSYVKKNLNL